MTHCCRAGLASFCIPFLSLLFLSSTPCPLFTLTFQYPNTHAAPRTTRRAARCVHRSFCPSPSSKTITCSSDSKQPTPFSLYLRLQATKTAYGVPAGILQSPSLPHVVVTRLFASGKRLMPATQRSGNASMCSRAAIREPSVQ